MTIWKKVLLAGGGTPLVLSHISSHQGGGASETFVGADIGADLPGRMIIAAVNRHDFNGTRHVDLVCKLGGSGGTSMDQVVQAERVAGGQCGASALFKLTGYSGSSADIYVDESGSGTGQITVSVFNLYGWTSETPVDTDSINANSGSGTLSLAGAIGAVGIYAVAVDDGPTVTITNDYEIQNYLDSGRSRCIEGLANDATGVITADPHEFAISHNSEHHTYAAAAWA